MFSCFFSAPVNVDREFRFVTYVAHPNTVDVIVTLSQPAPLVVIWDHVPTNGSPVTGPRSVQCRQVTKIDLPIYIFTFVLLNMLKVWSTVKIRGTRVPQKSIVPVGRPSPYSIIILNMRFIPKASFRASSQITASSYILERHL